MEHGGLRSGEAQKRLERFGPNVLTYKRQHSWLKKLLAQFADVLVLILLIAATFSFFAGEEVDAIIIMVVVILNAAIGFTQEMKAERAMEALDDMLEEKARVIRDGNQVEILSSQVVPGDYLILDEGDRVAADAIVYESNELKCSDAALTGESLPVLKEVKKSSVYMGTSVASGFGIAIVQSTGMKTEFGKIAHLTNVSEADVSPLQLELQNAGLFVLKAVVVMSAVLVVVSVLRGDALLAAILFGVAVAVAAVPEGLPAAITIALALGMQRLSKKKAIVKKLSSVETLGSVNVICTDKTGTLTKNEMTAQFVWIDGVEYTFEGVGFSFARKMKCVAPALKKVVSYFALCQTAQLQHIKGKWRVLGDPTEAALIVMARKCGLDERALQQESRKLRIVPFSSDRKMMSIAYSAQGGFSVTKGAFEEVIARCRFIRKGTKKVRVTQKEIERIRAQVAEYENRALRVLALASKDSVKGDVESTLIFEGLVAMIDPPREEVLPAVRAAYKAGIKVVMITGDAANTAYSIADSLEIVQEGTVVMTGQELENLSERELKKQLRAAPSLIFSRVSPADKLRVVNALKKMDLRVAVTGDGVNDAPALKRADIGIAMGITGTAVSREASEMVLTDDSFATIVAAIAEGRSIYANMKKFIYYMFSSNIGELFVVFVALFLGLPLPMTAVLILLVNLGTDVFPALALGVDGDSEDLMSQAPRDVHDRIVNWRTVARFVYLGTLMGIIILITFMYTYNVSGGDLMKAQTVAFVSLVMAQMLNVFNCRSFNRSVFLQSFPGWPIWMAIASSVSFVILLMYVPFFAKAISLVPLNGSEWLMICVASFTLLFVEEIRKLVFRQSYF